MTCEYVLLVCSLCVCVYLGVCVWCFRKGLLENSLPELVLTSGTVLPFIETNWKYACVQSGPCTKGIQTNF